MASQKHPLQDQVLQFVSTSSENLDARSLSPYVNQDNYSWRAPSPPRIYIPPPGVDFRPLTPLALPPDLPPNKPNQLPDRPSDAENQAFLDRVTNGDYNVLTSMNDWTYEDRRKAQMILPFLYLAPYQAAKDRAFLVQEGITMLMGVRERKSDTYMNPKVLTAELGIELVVTDVASHQQLIASLPVLINTINNHLLRVYERNETTGEMGEETRKTGKVLLFCESGNERSAGVATAYLMSMYAFDLAVAVQTVQGQRFCVTFDDSLKQWLLNYESILVARRQVEAAAVGAAQEMKMVEGSEDSGYVGSVDMGGGVGASVGPKGKGKQKRVLTDVYDGDTEMGGTGSGDMDGERFKEREDWVPFGDKMS